MAEKVVGSFLFLRFFVPALCNDIEFGSKEDYLMVFNDYLREYREAMKEYICFASSPDTLQVNATSAAMAKDPLERQETLTKKSRRLSRDDLNQLSDQGTETVIAEQSVTADESEEAIEVAVAKALESVSVSNLPAQAQVAERKAKQKQAAAAKEQDRQDHQKDSTGFNKFASRSLPSLTVDIPSDGTESAAGGEQVAGDAVAAENTANVAKPVNLVQAGSVPSAGPLSDKRFALGTATPPKLEIGTDTPPKLHSGSGTPPRLYNGTATPPKAHGAGTATPPKMTLTDRLSSIGGANLSLSMSGLTGTLGRNKVQSTGNINAAKNISSSNPNLVAFIKEGTIPRKMNSQHARALSASAEALKGTPVYSTNITSPALPASVIEADLTSLFSCLAKSIDKVEKELDDRVDAMMDRARAHIVTQNFQNLVSLLDDGPYSDRTVSKKKPAHSSASLSWWSRFFRNINSFGKSPSVDV
eukprot:jgi/Hompol1/7035/HPOL_002970-RA